MRRPKPSQRASLGALTASIKTAAAIGVLCLVAPPAYAASPDLMFSGGGERMTVPTQALADIERKVRDDGLNELYFQLSDADTKAFADLTARLEGQTLTITFCGEILAAPTVLLPIENGSILITGGTDAATTALFEALVGRRPCPDVSGS